MDKCNWSNLLLNWVNHTEFSTTYYDTLEQTDIKSFYEQFKQSFTVTAINEDTIYEFLKVHFPSFQYHLDDLNELSSLDYVYVYSLLMYFGCVKCPDPHFHNTCQRLSSHQQSTIASFLGIILNNNRFDHNSIRSAISQTSPKTPIVMSTESPLRGFKMDMSPPTPKTSLLEDKSRETHFLKAQLDTERYERGVLEILLKQSEEKIEKLTQNQKKHIETNHKLQSQILQHTTENVSPTKNIKEEQIKKKLRKEISSKEETIIALKSEIENLVDHNKEVNDKLAFTKTQMSMWIEKSRLFEQLMEDIKEELDRKNELIKILQEANGDLQNFIRETRNSPENGNGLNNSSGDFLDLSLSRVTAASSETFSPENLGRSVVDVQLREKEIENNLLKENIQQMWLLFERHRSILNFDDNVDHGSFGDAFAKFAEKFESHVGNFMDLQKMAEELSIEKNVLSNENMEVEQRLEELSNVLALEKTQNEELSMKISKLTERSNKLEITEKHLSQLLDETNNSVQNKAEENRQLLQEIIKIKESNAKLETQIRTSDADALQLKSIIQSSSEQLDASKAKISQLESNHQDISTKNIELLKQIDSYISQIEVISNTNCTLNEVNKSNQLEAQRLIEELTAVGQSRHSEIETLTCNTELVKSQNDELNQIILQLRDENKEIKNDMNVLIQKLDAIKAEKIAIEVLFEKVKLEYEEKIVSLENEIARLKSQINALETSQAEQKSEIVALQQERKEMNCDTILIIDNLQERNDTLKKENGELQSEREKLTKDFEGAKLLNELLQDEKHLMASKCELSNEKLCRLEAALKNHEERNGELSQKMSEMKIGHTNALQDAEAKSKVLEANRNEKQLEVDRLITDLEAVTSHKTKLETEIERFQNEFASQSIKYDCDVKELETKLKSASSELQRRASEVEQMREAQIKLEENVASLNSLKEIQQEKISQLEKDNVLLGNEFSAEIADKNEQIRMYETASSELEAKLQITNGEIQKNSDKILSTNSELLEARSKCSELRAECAKIQAQHSELEQEKIELLAKIEMLENSATENTKKIEKVESVNSALTTSVDELKVIESANAKVIADLEAKLEFNENMGAELNTAKSENSAVTQKLSEVEQELAAKNTALRNSQEKIQVLAENLQKIEVKVSELEGEKLAVISNRDDLQRISADTNAKLQKLEDLNANLETIKKSNETMIAELETKLESISQESETQLSMAETQKSTITQKILELEEELTAKNTESRNSEDKIQVLEDNLKKVEVKVSELEVEKLEVISKRDDLQKISADANAKLQKLEDLNANLEANKKSNETMIVELETKLKSAETRMAETEAALVDKLNSAFGDATKSSERLKQTNKSLQDSVDQVETLTRSIAELKCQLAESVQAKADIDIELTKLQSEFITLQDTTKSTEQSCQSTTNRLETELMTIQKENESFKLEIDHLMKSEAAGQESINNLKSEVNIAILEKSELSENLESKIRELETNEATLKVTVEALESQLESQTQDNIKIRNNIKQLEEKKNGLEVRITELLKSLETKMSQFSDRLLTAGEEHNTMMQNMNELKQQLADCKEEKLALEERIRELDVHLERLRATSNVDKSTIAELTANLASKHIECDALSADYKKTKEEMEQLTFEIKSKETTIGTLKVEITEKQCSIASVEKEKFQLTNEIASFQNRETQLSALQSKLEQFEEAHEKLNLRYQKQMLQLSISEEKNKELAQRIVALEKEADEYKVNYTESVEQITTLETTTKAMQQEFAEYKTKTDANNLADLADLNELVKQKSHAIESLTNEATITAGIIAEHEQKVKQYEKKLSKVIDEKRESEKKIDELADVILEKQTTITEFERRLNEASAKSSHSNDEKDQLLEKEKELTKRLLLDVAIFQAKLYKTREVSEQKEKEWLAEKEVLLGKVNGQKSAEDAIQENRIELVGKLDKMKAKMKTLYTEEMSKVKVKYESELARQQTDHQKFTEKYDVHIQKLSKQIYQLNEDKLELQKENEMAKTKIRFLDNNSLTTNPRVSNILQPPQSFGSTNLRMEDEEGEMFNNTYLTDLKTGNSSAWLGRDSVRLSELQYRNSLMPPHLRSSYLPQYGDQNLREEDIKDPPIGFDDSLNSLLQSGQRKKLSGATAYKRPGPPTPSKNAGRLSLGSVSIDREVLKETNDNNYSSNVTMRKNTPGKLMSLFSSSKAKDENSTPKRRISIFNKRNSNVISKRY